MEEGDDADVNANLSQRGRKPLITEYSEQAGVLYRAFAHGISTTQAAVLVNEWRLQQDLLCISWSAVEHFRLHSEVIETSRRGYKKSGKDDPEAPWSIARLAQSTQFLEQYQTGLLPPRQRKSSFPPLFLDGLVVWDEHHRQIVLGNVCDHLYI